MSHYTLQVAPAQEGLRLDKYIALQIQELSRSRIQAVIEAHHVLVNKEIIKECSARVKQGDVIDITLPPVVSTDMQPTDIPLDIVYEDSEMLVINKPAGLTVHPGAGNYQDTMANALLAYCGDELSGIGGVSRPGIVHRLDKDTSGLLVAAKTDRAHQGLSAQIACRSLKRLYVAVMWGVPTPAEGKITGNIARSRRDRTKMALVQTGGKEAVTHYRVRQVLANGAASLVECRLETGRTHQIRLHFSANGHPLIGDPVYGGHDNRRSKQVVSEEAAAYIKTFTRQALHSRKIGFTHPLSGEYKEYQAPIPEDMQKLIAFLGGKV